MVSGRRWICHLSVAILVTAAVMLLWRQPARCEDFYADPQAVIVERHGQVVSRLPAERIPLQYAELNGRAEANAASDSKGNIWAAIGYSVGVRHQAPAGLERLFHSCDGGKTWTSQPLPMTEKCNFVAFTVLQDDTLLLATEVDRGDPSWRKLVRVFRSEDRGETWQQACQIRSQPFEHIGEGFLSMTQLDDGTVLLPITRWTERADQRELQHGVFVSKDRGRTFPVVHPTFFDCAEAHVIQLQSGRLLGAFRHQRPPHPGETPQEIRALGGNPDWVHPTTGKRPRSAFKHVWIGESDDNGRTWKNLGAVRDSLGRPLLDFGEAHGQLVQVPDGRVVLAHDCRYPYQRAETRARISRDEGQTWEPEIYHVSDGMGYPASVALPDGTIVTIVGNTRLDNSFQPIGGWKVQVVRWKLAPGG